MTPTVPPARIDEPPAPLGRRRGRPRAVPTPEGRLARVRAVALLMGRQGKARAIAAAHDVSRSTLFAWRREVLTSYPDDEAEALRRAFGAESQA